MTAVVCAVFMAEPSVFSAFTLDSSVLAWTQMFKQEA